MKDKKHLGHEAFFNLSSGWRDSLGHQRQPWNGPTVNEKDDFCARPWSTLCSPTKEGGSLILTGTGASPALMIRFPTFPLICPTQCSVTVIYNYHHSILPRSLALSQNCLLEATTMLCKANKTLGKRCRWLYAFSHWEKQQQKLCRYISYSKSTGRQKLGSQLWASCSCQTHYSFLKVIWKQRKQ